MTTAMFVGKAQTLHVAKCRDL